MKANTLELKKALSLLKFHNFSGHALTVTVTVTEEFVVRPLQLVRWRIIHSQIVVFKTPHKRKKTNRS